MGDLVSKLSSYNILNYLLTGIVFVVLTEYFTHFSFVQDDLFIAAFVYYLIGMLVSRIGSLAIEPLLKRIGFLNFAPYDDFVVASERNPKIDILSEANNVYRSLLSASLSVLFLRLLQEIEVVFPSIAHANSWFLILFILSVLLFSYRKQTNYVRRRVEAVMKNSKPTSSGHSRGEGSE